MNVLTPCWLFGLALLGPGSLPPASAPETAVPPAVVRVRKDVEPRMNERLAVPQKKAFKELELGRRYPALAKIPVRSKGIRQPWEAMTELERYGLDIVAAAAARRPDPGRVLESLAATLGKPAGKATAVPLPPRSGLDDLVAHIVAVFDAAAELRARAAEKISEKHREFLFTWSSSVLVNYGPQVPFNARSKPILENDRIFVALAHDRIDWGHLAGAARTLLTLADTKFRQKVIAACAGARPTASRPRGVTGALHVARKTPHGWILIGARGRNTYDLAEPVACVVDLGGNDEYRGIVAASTDADHPLGVVIDVAGDDRYAAPKLGLATGRFGVGLLVDLAGRDRYELAEATGGVGLAGIGILLDAAGDDTYVGSKFTQGVAIGGIGLLLDLAGDDRHTAFGYGVGLGGSAGVGAVIDVAGSDHYQCGSKYPSGYNSLEKPPPKPGDPRFQWTAFGMGTGLGRRIVGSGNARDHRFALAGGVGMVLDLSGDDRYESANFSQGCGYYFGVGLKLDMNGDDRHEAARYGHAAGAHFGMGLFIDYAGRDEYDSTGPTYNAGCAWDHSIFVAIDAGAESDTYRFQRSAGLGRADIGSWAVFADLGGADHYGIRNRPGRVSRTGVAVFYDREGKDTYEPVNPKAKNRPANGEFKVTEQGGMFWDRK